LHTIGFKINVNCLQEMLQLKMAHARSRGWSNGASKSSIVQGSWQRFPVASQIPGVRTEIDIGSDRP